MRLTRLLAWTCGLLVWTCAFSSGGEPSPLILRLTDGGFVSGQLLASQRDETIAFQADGFRFPFHFGMDSIRSISQLKERLKESSPDETGFQTAHEHDLFFELFGGSVFCGQLMSVSNNSLTVKSSTLGTFVLERARLRSIAREGRLGDLLYNGPKQLDRWYTGEKASALKRSDASPTKSMNQGITIGSNVNLPSRAHLQFELSWLASPNFVLAIGTLSEAPTKEIEAVPALLRIEAWNKALVIIRESNEEVVVKKLLDLSDSRLNRLELNVYFDSDKGKALVTNSIGRILAELSFSPHKGLGEKCIHLTNHGGRLSLDQLKIRQWNATYDPNDSNDAIVELRNGEKFQGVLSGWNESKNEVEIAISSGETRSVSIKELQRINVNSNDSGSPPSEPSSHLFEILLSNQSRVLGSFPNSTTDHLKIQIDGVHGHIEVLPEDIVAVFSFEKSNRNNPEKSDSTNAGRFGFFKASHCELAGYLSKDSDANGPGTIVWHPTTSATSSPVDDSCNGAILFGKAATALDSTRQQNTSEQAVPKFSRPRRASAGTVTTTKMAKGPDLCQMKFQTGDSIDAKIILIDEKGVAFESTQTSCEFASHDKLESISFGIRKEPSLAPEERRRLTTVPRQQKFDPPSHLVLTNSGDTIRGQLVSMTQQGVEITVRQRTHRIEINRISEIIWLHDRAWESDQETRIIPVNGYPQKDSKEEFSVHAVRENGKGITFRPVALTAGKLTGTSDLFGECSVEIDKTDRILFGKNVGRQLRLIQFDPWLLSLAKYPKEFQDETADSKKEESKIVGKACADIVLPTLKGSHFSLSEQRGKVVVIEFWASWCGPCMQSLPRVEEMIGGINSDKLFLVAVNLKEDYDVAQAAISRVGIKTTVALDEAGELANSLEVIAIPSAVVINAEGIVVKVVTGGDQNSRDRLRDAIFEELGKK